jgi:hypothetical protein
MDELHIYPYNNKEIDTVYKALSIRAAGPDGGLPFLGTKMKGGYEWMTVK